MKTLEAAELLSVWEEGLNQPLLQKALILLAAAFPGKDPETLVKLSVGQRDQHLLQLRDCLFGQKLLNTALCPQCNERVEWENRTTDFLAQSDEGAATSNEFELEAGEYALRFRLPNSLDIAAVVNNESSKNAQQQLLSRCLLEANRAGTRCDFAQLPDFIIQKLIHQIETLDTHADISIKLNCPHCSHDWVVLFDIASFLWKEVNDWAGQMMQIVYKLAAAYGWSEREILGISPVRRQLYLGMLG